MTMIPAHFRTIREWVSARRLVHSEPVIAQLEDRLGVPADVLIDPARIEAVVRIYETVTERSFHGCL